MATVDWRMRGPYLAVCNCDYGCPCQFNSLPTHGDCRASAAMQIETGHFGDTKLEGVRWAAVFAWPKAIHEGNGEVMAIIDEGASEDQRGAILTILSGAETEPGATIWNVFSATFTRVHEPLFQPIDFEFDLESRTARYAVPGLLEVSSESIKNPVTGLPHQVRIDLPHGFEYLQTEVVSTSSRASDPIALDASGAHGHMHVMDIGPTGPAN